MYQLLDGLDADTAISVAYFFVRILRHRGVLKEDQEQRVSEISREASLEEKRMALQLCKEAENLHGKHLDAFDSESIREMVSEITKRVNRKLADEVSFDRERSQKLLNVMRAADRSRATD